jgi:hypothetical protein
MSQLGHLQALPHRISNVRCTSISRHTKSAQATISSENNALGLSMSDEQYELIALVVERIDAFGTERQLGKSLQPIETK